MSSALRLPNGNTLAHLAYPSAGMGKGTKTDMMTMGNSILVEVDKNMQVVAKCTLDLKGEAIEAKTPTKYNPAKIMFYEKDYTGIKVLMGLTETRKSGAVTPDSPLFRTDRASGRLEIQTMTGCDIDLFTMQGKKVYSTGSKNPRVIIEAAVLPRGVYCARISRDNKTLVSRAINIH
jgi:hypothetical protein